MKMATTYLNIMRPLFANHWYAKMLLLKLFLLNYLIIRNNLLISINSDHRSVIPATAGIPEKPAFFISAAGRPMNESMISKRVDAIGKRLNPSMPGNLRRSRLRKGIVTIQRSSESAAISPKGLAKQMSHSVSTAQKYYNIEDEEESDMRAHSFLRSLFKPKPNEASHDPQVNFVGDDTVQTVVENISLPKESNLPLPPPKESNPPLPPPKESNPPLPPPKEPNPPLPPAKECMPPPKECILPLAPTGAAPVHHRAGPPEKSTDETSSGSRKASSARTVTFGEKVKSWLTTGKISLPSSSSTASSWASRHYWSQLQGEVLYNATRHLPFNSGVDIIYKTVQADKSCQEYQITELFSRQQICDKFKNLAKKGRL